MLNNIRLAKLDDYYTVTLKSKFIGPGIENLKSDTLHIFAENAPADTLNLAKLEALDSPLQNIPSIDLIPKNVSPKKVEEVLVALKVTLADEQYYCILKQMAE